MTTVRRWAALGVVLPLILAGCSDDPEPKFAPPSDTPSPTETSEPPGPEPWEVKSEKGAVAFAKHWVDVFNDAAGSGQTSELLALGTGDCQTCQNFADLIEEIYQGGGRYVSKGWSVARASSNEVARNETALALRIRQPTERIIRPGESTQRRDPAIVTYSAELRWEDESWRMDTLLLQS